jgi:ABC-type enterochelin transport system permease subunit
MFQAHLKGLIAVNLAYIIEAHSCHAVVRLASIVATVVGLQSAKTVALEKEISY